MDCSDDISVARSITPALSTTRTASGIAVTGLLIPIADISRATWRDRVQTVDMTSGQGHEAVHTNKQWTAALETPTEWLLGVKKVRIADPRAKRPKTESATGNPHHHMVHNDAEDAEQ